MRKLRILVAVALTGISATAALANEAQAVQWAGYNEPYYLSSGQTGYLNHTVTLYASNGYSEVAKNCTGIVGYGESCSSNTNELTSLVLSGDVSSEPYLHDHSGYGGYFDGWYFS